MFLLLAKYTYRNRSKKLCTNFLASFLVYSWSKIPYKTLRIYKFGTPKQKVVIWISCVCYCLSAFLATYRQNAPHFMPSCHFHVRSAILRLLAGNLPNFWCIN